LGELPSIFWTLACEAVSAFDLTAEHAEKNGNGFTAEHARERREQQKRRTDWEKTATTFRLGENGKGHNNSRCEMFVLFSLFFTHP